MKYEITHEKLTLSKVTSMFLDMNRKNGITTQFGDDKNRRHAVVVFKQGPWFKQEYSEVERSYKFASDNKSFIPDLCGNSIYADCLDGVDHIRLEQYLGIWEIDYCYIV